MKPSLLFSLWALAGCASRPPFRPLIDGIGYTAAPTPNPKIIALHVELPPHTKDEVRLPYLDRAAGEECAARHFNYFDFGETKTGDARAYCFTEDRVAHLGANFAMIAPHDDPDGRRKLEVRDTEIGRHSPLHTEDHVLQVNGQAVADEADLKDVVAAAGRQGRKQISVQVERSGIPLSLTSPVYVEGGHLSTAESLATLRKEMP